MKYDRIRTYSIDNNTVITEIKHWQGMTLTAHYMDYKKEKHVFLPFRDFNRFDVMRWAKTF